MPSRIESLRRTPRMRGPTMSDRYGEAAPSKDIADAVKYSKGRAKGSKIKSTDPEYSPEAKRAYDENWEAIFGHREIPHGS